MEARSTILVSKKSNFAAGRYGVIAVKLLIATALFVWLVRTGRLDLVQTVNLDLTSAVVAAVVLRVISLLIPVWRWCSLARGAGIPVSWITGIHIGLVGRFFSLALPGSLGLDSARLFYGRRIAPDRQEGILASVIVDRAIGALSLLFLSVALGIWALIRSDPILEHFAWLPYGLFLVAGTFDMARARSYLDRLWGGLSTFRHRPGSIVGAFVLSTVGHLGSFVAAWYAFQAYGSSVALSAVLVLQPAITLLWLLPLTPQGLGVADSAAHWVYMQAGYGNGAEVMLLLRAVGLAVGLCCSAAYFAPVQTSRR